MTAKNNFIHHVFFWLKNPNDNNDLQALIAGLEKLTKVSTIRLFQIGKAAGTSRDVIETSYSVSWILFFDSKEDEEHYQVDPIHLNFCGYLQTFVD